MSILVLLACGLAAAAATSHRPAQNRSLEPVAPKSGCAFTGRESHSSVALKLRASDDEIALFRSYLARSSIYFETGAGGSTYEAATTMTVKRIYSVEGDRAWSQLLSRNDAVHTALCEGRLTQHYVNIGGDGQLWSVPKDRALASAWPLYAGAIELLTDKAARPDLVFVDGRFRVAAALYACRVVGDDAFVMIHDYDNVSSRGYEAVQVCLEPVEAANTLQVFRRRRGGVDAAAVEAVLQAHIGITA